jgi:hypothetical protein
LGSRSLEKLTFFRSDFQTGCFSAKLMLFYPSMEEVRQRVRPGDRKPSVRNDWNRPSVWNFNRVCLLTHPLGMAANFQVIVDQAFAVAWRCWQEACSSLRVPIRMLVRVNGTGRKSEMWI